MALHDTRLHVIRFEINKYAAFLTFQRSTATDEHPLALATSVINFTLEAKSFQSSAGPECRPRPTAHAASKAMGAPAPRRT